MAENLKAQEQIRQLQRQRREAAWNAHRKGWTTRQIGSFLGVSHVQAQRDIAAVDKERAKSGEPRPATSKMSDTSEPGRGDLLNALIGGAFDDIHSGERTGPDSRFI